MKKCNRVGVDVSARELVVAIEAAGRREAPIVFSNDADGHRKLIQRATKRGASAQVVLESTGTYGLDLALALHRAKRVEAMVANPRAIAPFARASLQRSKTDRLDAETILEFAVRMPFEPWSPPAPRAHQQDGQCPHTPGALHARAGRGAMGAPHQGLLPAPSRQREDQDAGHRRRDAEAAPCHPRNARARPRLRWREVLRDERLTAKGVSNGSALSCEPQRLRGSPEAPELQCQRLPKVDWRALWLVGCSALLDGALRGGLNEMSKTTQKVLGEALRLELSERAELAAELLASLDGEPDEEVEAAWAAEIDRRAARARSGEDAGRPWAEARAAAKDALSER